MSEQTLLNPLVYVSPEQLVRGRVVAKDLKLFRGGVARSQLSGQYQTRFRGRGMEFEEVRTYQPGDDIRAIDWRVTARTQVTHTKVFREERERPVIIAVDQTNSMFFASQGQFKSVQACRLASSLAWAALNNNDRVGGVVVGENDTADIRPKRSRHSVMQFIRSMATFNQQLPSTETQSESASRRLLYSLRNIAKPGTAIFIISDFYEFDEHCQQQLFELNKHTDITLLSISDPLEQSFPRASQLAISDGQSIATLNTGDKSVQQQHLNHYLKRRQALEQQHRSLGISLHDISTHTNIEDYLREHYGRRNPIRAGR